MTGKYLRLRLAQDDRERFATRFGDERRIMLTHEQKKRVFQIFEQALELEPAARLQFITASCGGDQNLQAEVTALLGADTAAAINTGGLNAFLTEAPSDQIGRVFGHFRLVEHLGSGGMGLVFRGERTDDISQRVAVKLVRQELRSANSRARFNQERTTLARLEHPSIARLIDAGVAEDGRPWYVMEFVPGLPIDEYCERNQLDLTARVRLLIKLCKAVDAAHRLLVVHRDIKPSNVLVTADGTPKLIDFGIAKFLDSEADTVGLTRDAGALFTPHYAAPEQVKGDAVSTATDVYGLGALAFKILTGKKIFEALTKSDLDYLMIVTQREPELASRVAGNKELRGDLDNILRKALAREPAERYASASALAADLGNYLEHRPVLARAPTLLYTVGKFLRRNGVPVALGGLLAAASVTGLTFFVLQSREVAAQRNAAQMEAARAKSINSFLTKMLESADPRIGARDTTVAQVMDNALKSLDTTLSQEPLIAASILNTISSANNSLGRYPEGLAANGRALELYAKAANSERDYAIALGQRGNLLRLSGKAPDAEPVLRDALARLERLAPSSVEDADIKNQLANVLSDAGRLNEADPLFEQSIAQLRAAGVKDIRLSSVLNDYGVSMGGRGKFAAAVPLHREALQLSEAALGATHASTDDVRVNLGSALEGTGDLVGAGKIFSQVVVARLTALGAKHIDTLWAQTTQANNLLFQRRPADALTVVTPTAAILLASYGKDHPITLYSQSVAGRANCETGNQQRGLKFLNASIAGRERAYPPGHWLIANVRLLLGACQMYAGDLKAAEKTLLESIAIVEAKRGVGSRNAQEAYGYLADLYRRLRRPDEAAKWAAKILPSAPK